MNFYPRPPRGGRLRFYGEPEKLVRISIHALREEGDEVYSGLSLRFPISIHALREEGDGVWSHGSHSQEQFLSTPSARRATLLFLTFKLYDL